MPDVPHLIEVQKARLLTIVDGELQKIAKLSEGKELLNRDGRSMLETIARLLKQLQGDLVETDERKAGYLSPTHIASILRPTAP